MPTPATINEILEDAFVRFASKPDLLNYKAGGVWHSVSTEEFRRRVQHLALGLHRLGLRYGDRAALFSENRIEWNIADLAVLTLGAVLVPIYATQAVSQVEYILSDANVRLLFVSTATQWQRVKDVCRNPHLGHIVTFDEFETGDPRQVSIAKLIEMGRDLDIGDPNQFEQIRFVPEADDLATLIYTSGTTGTPKGVMLTHGNLASNLISLSQTLGGEAGEITLSFLPFSHIFERVSFYLYLHHGNTIYYAEGLDRIGQNLLEVKPTVVVAVPRLFEKMYESIQQAAMRRSAWQRAIFHWSIAKGKEFARRKVKRETVPLMLHLQYALARKLVFSKWRSRLGLDRLRAFISGGAPLSPEIVYLFSAAGLEIFQGYGLTETSPGIATNSPNANKPGTVGRPIPGVEVRIDEDGEILVRGPNVMKGYLNRPDENQATFTRDGFLRTGDVGFFDEEGYLVVTDRKKDLLKTSWGKYIAPQPIESRLRESPYVAEAVLFADQKKFPSALLVPDFSALRLWAKERMLDVPEESALLDHPAVRALYQAEIERCNQGLGAYEAIKNFALVGSGFSIDGGELTPSMKVRRRVVEEKYRALIDGLYLEESGSPA